MEVVRKCSGCSAYQYDFLTDKITLKMRQTCSKTPGNPDVQGWKQCISFQTQELRRQRNPKRDALTPSCYWYKGNKGCIE